MRFKQGPRPLLDGGWGGPQGAAWEQWTQAPCRTLKGGCRFFQSLTSVYSCSKWVSTHFLPPALNSFVGFPCPVELPNKNNLSLSKLLVLQRV